MDEKLQLVLHEAHRQFKSESVFFRVAGLTPKTWWKYKAGETAFSNIKTSTYLSITENLFTPYETMLIDEAVRATKYHCYSDVIEAFHEIKLQHVKNMLELRASIEVIIPQKEEGRPIRKTSSRIRIIQEIGNVYSNIITFEINIPPYDVPSGHKNRLNWFNDNYKECLVR
ncbi:hypothetical protein JFL43_01315 [Viridibacillus sp. YIM B01967]|uniref:Uncharacterized protein n=1 Tax=Viridibacillus soli TaxID=2798301 RepID=A0ABS1H295_9BACL|nr:hypothetical protein [Viridibacillus soli]MBK3493528.1 hypothetical protein [Viridibacillus soli]